MTAIRKAADLNIPTKSKTSSTLRWLKFNAVGAGGIVVQLAGLAILKSVLKIDYLLATAIAVELAVVHNYFWHERFTWADRSSNKSWLRLLKFNLTTGFFSILGNVVVMHALVGVARVNYFLANILTIATCSIVNFLLSDRFVFQESQPLAGP